MTNDFSNLTIDPQQWRQTVADNRCVVVVHRLDDNPGGAEFSRALDELTEEEKARAARFYRDRDRHAFVFGRFLLRHLVAPFAAVVARDLSIEVNQWGKPFVAGAQVQFNLSQSNRAIALAISVEYEVGIDIEFIDRKIVSDSLVARCCTESERQWLLGADDSAFLQLWTLKEAIMKAVGRGLSIPPDSLEFSFADGVIHFGNHSGVIAADNSFCQLNCVLDQYYLSVALIDPDGPAWCEPVFLEYSAAHGGFRPHRAKFIGAVPRDNLLEST